MKNILEIKINRERNGTIAYAMVSFTSIAKMDKQAAYLDRKNPNAAQSQPASDPR